MSTFVPAQGATAARILAALEDDDVILQTAVYVLDAPLVLTAKHLGHVLRCNGATILADIAIGDPNDQPPPETP